MPTYIYETLPDDANIPPRRFEVVQRMTDEPLQSHPQTGEPVRRVITGGIGLVNSKDSESVSACGPSSGPCCGGVCGLS